MKGVLANVALKAIFLDLDNTLIDFSTVRRQAHVAAAAVIKTYYPGLPSKELIRVQKEKTAEVYREFISGEIDYGTQCRERFLRVFNHFGIKNPALIKYLAWFFNNYQESNVKPYASSELTLQILAPNYRLFIITNGPYPHQTRKLKLAGLSPFIEKLYAPGGKHKGKPEPHLFLAALKEANLRPEEVVHVGDEIADILGATNSGIKPIWIKPPKNEAGINDIGELPLYLNKVSNENLAI